MKRFSTQVLHASSVAALGGLLFGYDTAVIAGVIEFLQVDFGLSDLMLGWTVSSALVGCMLGAGLASWMVDKWGRKRSLLVCGILFFASAVWSALAGSAGGLAAARVLGGVGVGAASMLTPLYISEIAPARSRGALTTLNQIAILVGMVAVYLVNARIAGMGTEEWRVTTAWRWMFGSEAIPAAIFTVLVLSIPESPRWLVARGRENEAKAVLTKLGAGDIASVMQQIHNSLAQGIGSFREILSDTCRKRLNFALLFAVFQQITGINIVMYYAPRIFTSAGIQTTKAISHSVLIGLIMLGFTLVTMFLADRIGRRLLLIISSFGMVVGLAALGFAYTDGSAQSGAWLLAWVLVYVAAFSLGTGPLMWTLISEIFPNRVRGHATGVCVAALWFSNFLVSQFFPHLLKTLGAQVFWLFTFISVCYCVFVLVKVPETKGRTLEELETDDIL